MNDLEKMCKIIEAEIQDYSNMNDQQFFDKYIVDKELTSEDSIEDAVLEYRNALSIESYSSIHTGDMDYVHRICVGFGGPNIFITVFTKHCEALLEGGWGSYKYSSYLDHEDVCNYFGVEY